MAGYDEKEIREHQRLCDDFRRDLPEGPWTNEPDRKHWVYKDIDCLIVRNAAMGGLCGYIGIPYGHPWHGKGYDEIDVDCHGGATYSGECAHFVCHDPEEGANDNVWWVGFDCAHGQDYLPYMKKPDMQSTFAKYDPMGTKVESPWGEVKYRTVDYVMKECESMVRQLLQIPFTKKDPATGIIGGKRKLQI